MNELALHSIELCAGVGMLGEGFRAACEFLGFRHRTVCYVEREASAAAQIVALMEAAALDQAPVWSDMLTFDGAAWRGRVHCVIAGFPCQDLSVAGRRAGLDGRRSGLFFTVLDIAAACGAQFLVLENVSGIASATASVVDEAEGDLEERAAARVLGELADRGWNAEWTHLRASDVGANHERKPMVLLRLAHGQRWTATPIPTATGSRTKHSRTGGQLGNAGCERDRADESQSIGSCGGSPTLALAASQWSTPNVPNGGRSVSAEVVASRGKTENGKRQVGLESEVKHWATPTSSENSNRTTTMAPTHGNGHGIVLAGQAADMTTSLHLVLSTLDGRELSPTARTLRRRLNPAFACWLMGWPIWWTNPGLTSCVKPETELWRSKLQQHLSSLFGEAVCSADAA